MIQFRCPSCSKTLKVDEVLGGKTGKCPSCGQPCTIPTSTVPETPVASPPPLIPPESSRSLDSRRTNTSKLVLAACMGLIVIGSATFVLLRSSGGPPPISEIDDLKKSNAALQDQVKTFSSDLAKLMQRQEEAKQFEARIKLFEARLAAVEKRPDSISKKVIEKIIAAEEFVLVDTQGKVRANWRAHEDGGVHFLMSNKAGNAQLRLESGADGAAVIRLRGGQKANSAEMTMVFKDDVGIVRLYNQASKRSLSLNFSDSGSQVAIMDKNEKESLMLSADNDHSSIYLSDGKSKRLQAMYLRPQDKAGFAITEGENKIIWTAP